MRAGAVYIKLPIESISFEPITDSVAELKESIRAYGLLQPIGVVRDGERYKLVFGKRRLKACMELKHKYIHAVLISLRRDEQRYVGFVENIHRDDRNALIHAAEALKSEDIKEALCLSGIDMDFVKSYLMLESDARSKVNSDNARFVPIAAGDSKYFLRMCGLLLTLPANAKDKVRLSVLSDRRIFINEIQKILALMRLGGYNDDVQEDGEKIIIKKNAG